MPGCVRRAPPRFRPPKRSCRVRAIIRQRPNASSTCSWPARRASSTCSTTSRNLPKLEGKPLPPSVIGGQRYAFIRPDADVLGPQFKFAKHGQSGAELSEMLPHLGKVVDDICLIKSMQHRPVQPRPGADFLEHRLRAARPAEHRLVGDSTAWAARRTTCPRSSSCPPAAASAAARRTGPAASCPPSIRRPLPQQGDPILNVSSPKGVDAELQRDSLDLIEHAQPQASRRRRRPGNRHAHRLLRDGVSPADLRAGTDGS